MIHILSQLTMLRRTLLLALAALLLGLLAACSGTSALQAPASPPPAATAASISIATAPPAPANVPAMAAPTSIPTATTAPASLPTATTAPTSIPPTSPAPSVADAIKAVIQRANQEQQQALAAHDPTLMRDTATTAYYSQAAQDLDDLLNAGVTAIELVKLDWGSISIHGTTAAQASTVETWRTSFADGSTLQQADTNIYTLVRENNAWKVQDDQHPDTRRVQPPQDAQGASPTPAAPIAPGEADQSRNWAGYAATSGTFTAVSGFWTIPTISAGRASAGDATWVGIGGRSSHDLIQAGTDATIESGKVVYTAWIEMLPQLAQVVPLTVGANDAITVSISQQGDEKWHIRIRNATTGQSYDKTVTYQSSRSSAEWIEEAPAVGRRTLLSLDNFGTIRFTNAGAVEDGQQRSIAQANGQPITMFSRDGQVLAQPSKIGDDGSSFSVTRTNTPAPRVVPGSGSASG